jgi:small subunit ribosomal protein S1
MPLGRFGAFVEWAEGVEGLCHYSEVPGYTGRKSEELPIAAGQEFDFKIIKLNESEKKIGLSLKAVTEDEERARLEDYQRQAIAATSTIEEVVSVKEKRLNPFFGSAGWCWPPRIFLCRPLQITPRHAILLRTVIY